jgi:hypothetical protein
MFGWPLQHHTCTEVVAPPRMREPCSNERLEQALHIKEEAQSVDVANPDVREKPAEEPTRALK